MFVCFEILKLIDDKQMVKFLFMNSTKAPMFPSLICLQKCCKDICIVSYYQ